jgi:hypothetical protein
VTRRRTDRLHAGTAPLRLSGSSPSSLLPARSVAQMGESGGPGLLSDRPPQWCEVSRSENSRVVIGGAQRDLVGVEPPDTLVSIDGIPFHFWRAGMIIEGTRPTCSLTTDGQLDGRVFELSPMPPSALHSWHRERERPAFLQ